MNYKAKKHQNEHFSVNVKRFYIPFEISWTCSNCNEESSEDLNEQYLSYPDVGVPIDHNLYCFHCDHEEEIKIQLDFDLKIVE